jgi:hypothetical protein
MRTWIITLCSLASVALGGCSTLGGLTPDKIAAIEDQVIQDAIATCAFEPTVATIGTLIANAAVPTAAPIAATAKQLADSICASLKAQQAGLKATYQVGGEVALNVNGVLVTGHMVTPQLQLSAKKRLTHHR